MKLRTLFAVLCAGFMAMPAYAELKLGANVETNTTVSSSSLDNAGQDLVKFDNDGRVETALEARTENENGFFFAGKGCFEIQVDGGYSSCDVTASLGNSSFEFKVGHWEAEDMFPKGEDVYIAEVPGAVGRYEMNKVRGRNPNGMGVIFKFSDTMKLDARLAFDTDNLSVLNTNDGSVSKVASNNLGVRPVLVINPGNFTIKLGGEYLLSSPQDSDAKGELTVLGFGTVVEAKVGNLTIGVTGAMKSDDGKDILTTVDADGNVISTKEVDKDEVKTTSAGTYVKIPVGEADLFQVAGGFTTEDADDSNHMYVFSSYGHQLPVEGAKIKFGVSFANASDIGGSEDGTAFGARVRFNYTF